MTERNADGFIPGQIVTAAEALRADRARAERSRQPESDPDERIRAIIRALGPDEFTKGGKPEVDAINAHLDEPITAAERDRIWSGMAD